jgi:arylsulfatase A-like enzyme
MYYTDKNIGTLLAALERLGMRDNTIVVVTSDHGETVDPLLGGGHGLRFSTDELRVPMFVSNDRLFPTESHGATPANHLDLSPTLLGMVGLQPPASMLGRNLTKAKVEPRLLYVARGVGNYVGLIDGDYAYSMNLAEGLSRLYRIKESGFETADTSKLAPASLETFSREVSLFDDRVTLRHLELTGRWQ